MAAKFFARPFFSGILTFLFFEGTPCACTFFLKQRNSNFLFLGIRMFPVSLGGKKSRIKIIRAPFFHALFLLSLWRHGGIFFLCPSDNVDLFIGKSGLSRSEEARDESVLFVQFALREGKIKRTGDMHFTFPLFSQHSAWGSVPFSPHEFWINNNFSKKLSFDRIKLSFLIFLVSSTIIRHRWWPQKKTTSEVCIPLLLLLLLFLCSLCALPPPSLGFRELEEGNSFWQLRSFVAPFPRSPLLMQLLEWRQGLGKLLPK